MATKNKDNDWLDNRGRAVPSRYVPVEDRKKDQIVERAVKHAKAIEARMRKVKAQTIRDIDNYMAWLEEQAGVVRNGKGNLLLTNFSGDKQIELQINDVIEFDEKLHLAKAKIDECLRKWSTDANRNLKVVVDQAFEVDKKGRINKMAILKLRNLNIRDQEWLHAMKLLTESIQISTTRQYLAIRERRGGTTGKWETINLNFSSI